MIDFLCQYTVPRPTPAVARLLVTDEDVVRFLLRRQCQEPFLDLRDLSALTLVQRSGPAVRRVLQRQLVVRVPQNRIGLDTVARRQSFVRLRILHVLDAEARQRQTPVSLRVRVVLVQQALVRRHRPVELVQAPEMVRPVEQVQTPPVRHLGQRHRRAAMIARPTALAFHQHDVATTHPALQHRHMILVPGTC